MINKKTISRRIFLKRSGGVALLIGSSGILQLTSCKGPQEATEKMVEHKLSAWVHLRRDGQITIYNPAAEMGQGSMTALPLIFAEEMDADWEKVRVAFSPQEAAVYGSNWGSNKRMLTVGSRTVKGYYDILRQAGAQARQILLESVAAEWQVPVSALSTASGTVVHRSKGRKIAYGDIIPILRVPEKIAQIPPEKLKDPKNFRLIGKVIPRNDVPSKSDGSAKYSMDVQLPGMLYGMIERGNIHGAKPTLKNEATIRAMDGVEGIVLLDYGVGVVATSLVKALQAKKALEIEWSEADVMGFDSQEAYIAYERMLASQEEGRVVTNQGDFAQASATAARIYTADYKNDYAYHAQMEPVNAIVAVAKGGQSAEVWIGSQAGPTEKGNVAKVLGLEPAQVKVNQYYLGGGFGRRSKGDYSTETAILAKTVAPRPLKLIWTREDDLQYGMYRPISLQRMTACADANGKVTGLAHYVAGDGGNLLASGIKNEFYDIPNQHQEVRVSPAGVRIKHWRAVGHGPNKFAIESFIDEIAEREGIDPVDFRRKLMQKYPRALATLEKAAQMANWGSPLPEGRARGVAFLERSGTLSTGICEISLDQQSYRIKVHHFWSAHDAGVVIQPDNVVAQIEGGIIMGMSSVLKEQLTIKDGKVQQSNFHDYELLRMEDIPESIETAIIPSAEAPQGVGESGTPLVAGAIANAFASLTGKRLRHMPFLPDRVKEALES